MAELGSERPAFDMYALQHRPSCEQCLQVTVCDIALSSNVFLCT